MHLRKVIEQQSGKGQCLVFGATRTIGEYVMPDALERYLDAYPEAVVRMAVEDTSRGYQRTSWKAESGGD